MDFAFDGAIGEVVGRKAMDPLNPKGADYRYDVNLYRLSGTSKYNPLLQPNSKVPPKLSPEPPILEDEILERDIEKTTVDELNAAKNTWKTVVFTDPASNNQVNWGLTSGGKRRSKSAKRVKTAKRAKSRRTRRQRI